MPDTLGFDPFGIKVAITDFGFDRFVTLKLIRLAYALLLSLIGLAWLVVMVLAASFLGPTAALLSVLVGAVVVAAAVIVLRVWCETIAVIFQIGEGTRILAEQNKMISAPK